MERPQYTSIPREELRRIETETQRAESIEDLRALFDRLQAIRRTFIDDFDVQLAISHVQQSVVERGRVLLEAATIISRDSILRPLPRRHLLTFSLVKRRLAIRKPARKRDV